MLNCASNSTTATCLGVSVLTNASGSSATMSVDSVAIAASNSHMLFIGNGWQLLYIRLRDRAGFRGI